MKPAFETPKILSDLPIKDGRDASFHFNEFAVTLARLIADKKTLTPLVIGINGAWGSGKTTLLRCLQEKLDKTFVLREPTKPAVLDFVNDGENPQSKFRTCRTVWFNAWKYADEEQLLVALVRVIVQEMFKDDLISKGAAALLEPFTPHRDVINTVLGWCSIKIGGAELGLNTGEPKETPFAEKTAMLDLFDEAFDRLMAAWVHRSLKVEKISQQDGVLVVLIDDLDRCLPEKTVQVLEAIKLFLDKPGCVFVLGADTEVVRTAVESYYQNAKVTGQNAVDYLEKIIQIRFNLPPVVAITMQDFLKRQALDGEMLAQWQTLIAAAEINPRRVKAVINDVELQWRMLVNSGEAAGVRRDDFIRWNALMRAAPSTFRNRFFNMPDDDLGIDLRYKFIMDALIWMCGDEKEKRAVKINFQDFENNDSKRLREVLKQIKYFSDDLTPDVLNSIVHLTAPLEKTAPAEKLTEKPVEATSDGLEHKVVRVPAEPKRHAPASRFDLMFGGELEEILSQNTIEEERVAISKNLLMIGNIEFIKIPSGKFIMGSKDDNPLAFDNETPQHTMELPDYWMAKFTLMNDQYFTYIGEGNHPVLDWKKKNNHPVVNITWHNAMDYCIWFNKQYKTELQNAGITVNLPTEAQWEKAARGEYGNEWPWGNKFDKNNCNSAEGKKPKGDTTPVDAYPQGESPYGIADMVGNVWEWTHTLFKRYPYKVDDFREDEKASGPRVFRGGSFGYPLRMARCAYRIGYDPDNSNDSIGFRVCASPIS
jgi:formylglycine-generating enzyme required for sulfatase activity